jgi:hypothetical protein
LLLKYTISLKFFCSRYDEIYLYYGPVGHTHNGVDSVHHVHNESACNFTLGTPADLANAFHHTWADVARPGFYVLEQQLGWSKFYDHHLVKVKGFTKTKKDELAVHGFRFKRSPRGIIEMHWKEAPSESAPWRGVNHEREGHGFRILRSRPRGCPLVVEPKPMKAKLKKSLLNLSVKKALMDEGMGSAFDWLKKVVGNNGKMTVNRIVEPAVPGTMGDLVNIGAGERSANVRLITNVAASALEFWALPETAVQQPVNEVRALPLVRYLMPAAQKEAAPLGALVDVPRVQADGGAKKRRGRPKLSAAEKKKRKLDRKALQAVAGLAAVVAPPEPVVPALPQPAAVVSEPVVPALPQPAAVVRVLNLHTRSCVCGCVSVSVCVCVCVYNFEEVRVVYALCMRMCECVFISCVFLTGLNDACIHPGCSSMFQ